ncbi:hypothetical protein GJ744_008399 [Endocarpon pusillum]|uniref:Uncharacterized protein n=1 Tax=Endocarpon pusillum TaxID=364733 RepID=A0A8H7E3B7_9EURO|nr:hypothetical protein GJ744_008399 [Endocarpon pusillum]
MASQHGPTQIYPGKGLGFLTLGASLHNILTRLKAQPQSYPSIDLSYSSDEPVLHPVILDLASSGIRLQFDGPDQRLRLVEVLDFSKASLTYKGTELLRRSKSTSDGLNEQDLKQKGPAFRHVYNRLFGPSYPGEYIPPTSRSVSDRGTYVLSYPGVAFCFPLLHSSWSERADFVSLLSSTASLPAISMAIFQGSSWSEARATLFTKQPQFPRSIALTGRDKDLAPDEVEEARIYGQGQIEFVRRFMPSFWVHLSETTPQDLIAEFGPPDAIYRKNDNRISIHGNDVEHRIPGLESTSPVGRATSVDTDHSSTQSYSEGSDREQPSNSADKDLVNPECFFNYFHHGFDAFVSFPTSKSPPFPGTEARHGTPLLGPELRVTKILFHANVPGSYPFNRHRRSRWSIQTGPTGVGVELLSSEMPFEDVSAVLKRMWHGSYRTEDEERSMQRGMVLNRGWGESPESSVELLGGWEDNASPHGTGGLESSDGVQSLGNTELFGFPGLLFEVVKNGTVSCLTVY